MLDLLPAIARLFFLGCLPASLSYAQAAILLAMGLQQRPLQATEVRRVQGQVPLSPSLWPFLLAHRSLVALSIPFITLPCLASFRPAWGCRARRCSHCSARHCASCTLSCTPLQRTTLKRPCHALERCSTMSWLRAVSCDDLRTSAASLRYEFA